MCSSTSQDRSEEARERLPTRRRGYSGIESPGHPNEEKEDDR